MASNTQTVPVLLRNLRDNGKTLLQCGALTYIQRNAEKLDMTCALSEEECTEMCRLVLDLLTNVDKNIETEGTLAMQAILKYFKKQNVKFFETALRVDRDKRLKILQFLTSLDDIALTMAVHDPLMTDFIEDCLSSIQTNSMEWLSATSCKENLQMLVQAENRLLADDEGLEELIVNNALTLLRKTYKLPSFCSDIQRVAKFDVLIMDKVVTLAYMGHKRQRESAIYMMNQGIEASLASRVKINHPEVWKKYKNNLEGPYSARMTLLVKACDHDWSGLWSISIQLLGTDLHRGAPLINNLLMVEESAFKSGEPMIRRQAFISWKLLIDNFALDTKELAMQRRVKLLCIPLTAKNSKSELITLKKLEVWWYLITKLYHNIVQFADPVVTQFLNFCFGPLGDTPLLSTKCDVIASPGKRFYNTKIIAIDALLQFMVARHNERKFFSPILKERLTSSVTYVLFMQCYKAFIHSVGEAVIIISQFDTSELANREEVCKVLWVNLVYYVRSTSSESKSRVYNELILVITELQTRSLEVPFINDFIRDVIVPELSIVANDLVYYDRTLVDLMTKIMVPLFLTNLRIKHCDAIKRLMWQTVRPETMTNYHPETLRFLETTLSQLRSVPVIADALTDCFELWFAYAEIACKYMRALQDVNEGTAEETNFKTIESIINFPFTHMHRANSIQAQKIAVHWKDVYKKYECQADTIPSTRPNEIFDNTSEMIEVCLVKNEKCYRIAVYCLDALLSTINYKFLLAQSKIPPIVRLIGDLTTIALHEVQLAEAECALKALSSLLITVYGHSPQRALAYMNATSQTVELMLKIDAEETLVKEITSTWETIVSILRGLSNLLDENFLRSYKQIFSLSFKHSNGEISSQTRSILELKDNIKESARVVLAEFAQEFRKALAKDTTKINVEKGERTPKSARIAGSFLNRKISSPRTINSKDREKQEKKLAPLPPEPDSQDYVIIKTDVNLDVNRLTEHQKESFKRRRDDIPAMYNNLSQSSSQDTQDLQQWFAGKTKLNDPPKSLDGEEKSLNIEEKATKDKKIDNPVDSENEKLTEGQIVGKDIATSRESTEKVTTNLPTLEIIASSGQNPISQMTIITVPAKCNDSKKSADTENKASPMKKTNMYNDPSPMLDDTHVGGTKSVDANSSTNDQSSAMTVKRLNFESREEYPDEKSKGHDENSHADLFSRNKTNRGRRSGNNLTDEQMSQSGTSDVAKNRGRSSGTDGETTKSESQENPTEMVAKSKVGSRTKGNTRRSQNSGNIVERGTKRKASSDSEIDESERDKRRRKLSRSPSGDDNETKPLSQIDKRTVIEISRLRIDMITDGPLTSRRRSKYNDDFVSSEILGRRSQDRKVASRGKTVRSRNAANYRRNSAITETENQGNSDVPTKRRRRVVTTDDDGKIVRRDSEESRTKSTKHRGPGRPRKNYHESGAASESQTIIDDDETTHESTTQSHDSDKSLDNTQNNGESSNVPAKDTADISTNLVLGAPETPMDLDEVVESSQDSAVLTSSHKRLSFGKIVKTNSLEDSKSSMVPPAEATIENKQPTASSPIIPAVEGATIGKTVPGVEDKIVNDDADETFLDISAIRPQLADDVPIEDNEKKAPEASKTMASPITIKLAEGNFNFSSPKTHAKRFAKPKGFAPQGRAAHMLGLVTKLAALERDGQVEKSQNDEEIATIKRMKIKDSEITIAIRDRPSVAREPERIGSPSGSRQEKIFNNMKAADYAASPPGKLFGNLKNNGEKISPKMEKSQANFTSRDNEISVSKDDDVNASLTDELPLLEWSNANPPSLTASPSASILKRNRSIVNETETDVTLSNRMPRKRVSFADPPVSKEMSYEIETTGSPHKVSKFVNSRGSLVRRDSPIRTKQSRFKMIQIDPERNEKDEIPRILSCDVDIDCERDNELLMKIAEDLEETVDLQTSDKSEVADSSVATTRNAIDTFNDNEQADREKLQETPDATGIREFGVTMEESDSAAKSVVTMEESLTQDLFNSSDEKTNSPKRSSDSISDLVKEQFNMSGQYSTMESFKLNVTDDSLIGSITDVSTEKTNATECLEDTIDAVNMTNLNTTGDSQETFNDMHRETSVRRSDTISEMDTLTVTDSILAGLPMTQDSQLSTQANVEIPCPELLNSTDSIYPSLDECHRPIDDIIDSLTNPLWRKNLAKYLETRGIRTIGDLARLSERDIVRIPVKGSSKIDFVRKVLGKFEKKLDSFVDNRENDVVGIANKGTMRIPDDMDVTDELPAEIRKSLGDISALACTTKLPGNTNILDVSAIGSQAFNDTVSDDDLVPHVRHKLPRTSTTNSISLITIDPTRNAEVSTVLEDTANVSKIGTIILSSDASSLTNKSVATWTEPSTTMATKSVASQATIDELLDEIDVDLVLQSAVKRISAEKLLTEYKLKMEHMSEMELIRETLRILGIGIEATLKLACRECGLDKVLRDLVNVFDGDKQLYVKVLNACCNEVKISDCLNSLDHEGLKSEICKKCSSIEILDMLTRTLKNDDKRNVKTPFDEVTCLNAILKRTPIDLIVRNTLGNDKIIPSTIILDVALRTNENDIVTGTIEREYPGIAKNIFQRRVTSETVVSHIEDTSMSREELLNVHKAVCAKLSSKDLLDAFNEAMKEKLNKSKENSVD